ncbi:hypothetical protein AO262_02280 [Pseudomonas fluorescens ABAC62]|nr:hypothetical protein AO262_02280 [Pseudomonas fluorescens ABAC62]
MPWKLASFGTLFAALALTGCSTPGTSEPAKDAAVTDAAHSRCESKAAEFTIGQRSDRLNLNTDDNLVITRVNCG